MIYVEVGSRSPVIYIFLSSTHLPSTIKPRPHSNDLTSYLSTKSISTKQQPRDNLNPEVSSFKGDQGMLCSVSLTSTGLCLFSLIVSAPPCRVVRSLPASGSVPSILHLHRNEVQASENKRMGPIVMAIFHSPDAHQSYLLFS